MSLSVFLAVILAALLHATWNALAKSGSDKHRSMTAVVLGHTLLALVLLPLVPLPTVASLPYLAAGVLLHVGYQFFLLASYRIGDLTQVYPIARGSAPLLVAGVSIPVDEIDRISPASGLGIGACEQCFEAFSGGVHFTGLLAILPSQLQ